MAKDKTKEKTKKKVERSALDLATELLKIREEKKTIDTLEKTLTVSLKEAMHREGTRESGAYELSTARSLRVEDSAVAWEWARQNNCLVPEKVDTSRAKEILRHTFDDPSKFGFAVVESERLIAKGKPEEE